MRARDHGLNVGHLYGSEKVGESKKSFILICFYFCLHS